MCAISAGKDSKQSSSSLANNKTSPRVDIQRQMSKTKRAVTFKAGLLTDKEVENYQGPLLSLDQIREPGESLTGFVFTKYILGVHAEMYSMQADKG